MVQIPGLLERVEPPIVPLAHEPEDRAEVVRKDGRAKPRAVDEPGGLEEVLLLRTELVVAVRVVLDRVRVDVRSALV